MNTHVFIYTVHAHEDSSKTKKLRVVTYIRSHTCHTGADTHIPSLSIKILIGMLTQKHSYRYSTLTHIQTVRTHSFEPQHWEIQFHSDAKPLYQHTHIDTQWGTHYTADCSFSCLCLMKNLWFTRSKYLETESNSELKGLMDPSCLSHLLFNSDLPLIMFSC